MNIITGHFTRPGDSDLRAVKLGDDVLAGATDARYDWAPESQPEADWARLVDRWRTATDPLQVARYTAPIGWEFVPDTITLRDASDVDWATATDAAPADRTAQGTALATMRRREADALANATAATERAERAERRVTEALAQRDAETDKLRQLWAALAEQADERQWCGEFEQFYDENNGEEYIDLNSEFDVTVRVSVHTRGLPNNIDSDTLRNAIYDLDRYDINVIDYSAVE